MASRGRERGRWGAEGGVVQWCWAFGRAAAALEAAAEREAAAAPISPALSPSPTPLHYCTTLLTIGLRRPAPFAFVDARGAYVASIPSYTCTASPAVSVPSR